MYTRQERMRLRPVHTCYFSLLEKLCSVVLGTQNGRCCGCAVTHREPLRYAQGVTKYPLVEDLTHTVWLARCQALYTRLNAFQIPADEGLDFKWGFLASTLVDHASNESSLLWDVCQSGVFPVCPQERTLLRNCRKLLNKIKQSLGRLIRRVKDDPACLAVIERSEDIPDEVKEDLDEEFRASSIWNDVIFTVLRQTRARAVVPSKPAKAPEKEKVMYAIRNGAIYWEEPDPMPAAKSAIEIERERRETLKNRVQLEEFRSAFGPRSSQPKSQFRRFRN